MFCNGDNPSQSLCWHDTKVIVVSFPANEFVDEFGRQGLGRVSIKLPCKAIAATVSLSMGAGGYALIRVRRGWSEHLLASLLESTAARGLGIYATVGTGVDSLGGMFLIHVAALDLLDSADGQILDSCSGLISSWPIRLCFQFRL